jgi:hypothetical protein
MIVKFSDEEFIDGVYSGIMRIHDTEELDIDESLSFVYDVELDKINITRRVFPDFNAPEIYEWSDYLMQNSWGINMEIKERHNYINR